MAWKRKVARGPSPLRGNKHPGSKLGPTDALMIFDAVAAGFSPSSVAGAFGVSVRLVLDIGFGARWGWLTEAASRERSRMRAIHEKVMRRARRAS